MEVPTIATPPIPVINASVVESAKSPVAPPVSAESPNSTEKHKTPKQKPPAPILVEDYSLVHPDTCWTRLVGFPFWPSRIVSDLSQIPANVMSEKHTDAQVAVFFYGEYTYGWLNTQDIKPFNEENMLMHGKKNKTINFKTALAECFSDDLYLANTERFNQRKALKKTPKSTPRATPKQSSANTSTSAIPSTSTKRTRKSDAGDQHSKKAKQDSFNVKEPLSEVQSLLRLRAKIQKFIVSDTEKTVQEFERCIANLNVLESTRITFDLLHETKIGKIIRRCASYKYGPKQDTASADVKIVESVMLPESVKMEVDEPEMKAVDAIVDDSTKLEATLPLQKDQVESLTQITIDTASASVNPAASAESTLSLESILPQSALPLDTPYEATLTVMNAADTELVNKLELEIVTIGTRILNAWKILIDVAPEEPMNVFAPVQSEIIAESQDVNERVMADAQCDKENNVVRTDSEMSVEKSAESAIVSVEAEAKHVKAQDAEVDYMMADAVAEKIAEETVAAEGGCENNVE